MFYTTSQGRSLIDKRLKKVYNIFLKILSQVVTYDLWQSREPLSRFRIKYTRVSFKTYKRWPWNQFYMNNFTLADVTVRIRG
jgi:hypothetical protein